MAVRLALRDRSDRVFRSLIVVVCAAILFAAAFSSTAHTSTQDTVRLASGSTVSLATPPFVLVGKRYAFTWAGGGPAQTYTVKQLRPDGWILVEVADEITNTDLLVPGERPTRWLNIGMALSIQEMRPHLF
jgi:hypothetical protein